MDTHSSHHGRTMLRNALRPVEHLLDDDLVQEVMINGPNNVWVERAGQGVSKTDVQISDVEIRSSIQILASLENKDARERGKDSIIDSRIDGFRFAAALKPTAMHGPSLSIRKHSAVHLRLDDYVASGAVPEEMAKVLVQLVKDRRNIIIAGGTSSGKTTFANALIGEIDPSDRVLTIEDTQELRVKVPNWVPLVSNEQGGITTRDLVRLSLRFRPDRIIVGEVRGGEAFDLLDAANTGHEGCMATLHASSATGALSRFESLVLRSGINWPHEAIKAQIGETFDYVVFMARMKGIRRLAEIVAVRGYDLDTKRYQTDEIYRFSET